MSDIQAGDDTDVSDIQAGDDTDADSAAATPGIDVDLTTLSGTMVYSEVFNMIANPEDYVGKTIKMQGQFFVSVSGKRFRMPAGQRFRFRLS